jgi:hypothetical protein
MSIGYKDFIPHLLLSLVAENGADFKQQCREKREEPFSI